MSHLYVKKAESQSVTFTHVDPQITMPLPSRLWYINIILFIPSTISLWNELAVEIRQKQTLEEFKSDIKSTKEEPNILYYYGKRWPSVHHARIWIECSKLNQHLCENLHVIENSSCSCEVIFENTYHYFFECPHFIELRQQLFNAISAFTQGNMNIILNGDNHLSLSQNKLLFEAVHSYIEKTRRFY